MDFLVIRQKRGWFTQVRVRRLIIVDVKVFLCRESPVKGENVDKEIYYLLYIMF